MLEQNERSLGSIALGWWRDMGGDDPRKASGAKRGAISGLRRARTYLDVLDEPLALNFVRSALQAGHGTAGEERLIIIPAILASIRKNVDGYSGVRGFGKYLSLPRDKSRPAGPGNHPPIDETKFHILIRTDPSDLIDALRRTVEHLDGTAPIGAVVQTIQYWGTDRTIRDLTLNYFNVYAAVPAENTIV